MARGESLGDAYIRLHLDEGPFDRELAATKTEADALLRDIGDHYGETISESMTKEVRRHGHDFTKAIEDSTARETIHVRSKVDYYNVRDNKGRFTKRVIQDLEDDIEQAFTKATAPGGPFSRIGSAISDAIGSGFNVSGKSQLIPLLAVVVGGVVGLVVAAIQLVNLLAGLLVALPGALAGVAAQVGVLYLAFHGLGTAIAGAFSATNAQQLHDAIKNLTPEAQKFVLTILPLKGFFHDLQKIVQNLFFGQLQRGNAIQRLIDSLGPTFFQGMARLAGALGYTFNQLALVLGSPLFKTFLKDVLSGALDWLRGFTPQLVKFLMALIRMADQALPFLTAVGNWITHGLYVIAEFFNSKTLTGEFQKWLSSLLPTLDALGRLMGALGQFLIVLLDSTNKAGGKTVIDTLAEALDRLSLFFASPLGIKALEGLIDFANVSIQILAGLAVVIGVVAAAFDYAGEAIKAFFEWIGPFIGKVFGAIGDFFVGIWHKIVDTWDNIVKFVRRPLQVIKDDIEMVAQFFTDLPGRILARVESFGTLLYQAGKNLIQGLIHGIEHSIPGLTQSLNWITAHLPSWKGPMDKDRKILEPSGQAVMEGFITGINSGARELRDALTGLTHDMSGVNTRSDTGVAVNFGPGAINVSFMGNPTQEQAFQTGQAVGAGINSEMEMRNVALGVRRM